MKKIATILAVLLAAVSAKAQTPTLYLSDLYTTHISFSTAVSYVDISSPQNVAAKIVETNKNVVAVKAREEFSTPSSITVIESNGIIHTFQIHFTENPDKLVFDAERDFAPAKPAAEETAKPVAASSSDKPVVKVLPASEKRRDANTGEGPRAGNVAPTLDEVLVEQQHLHHIGDKQYGVQVLCTNILVHNDVFYLVLTLENNSGISYTPSVASFNVVPRKVGKRTLDYTNPVTPRSSLGSLFAMPGKTANIVYCFDKVTILKSEVFKIYVTEKDGQRNFVLTLTAKDINKAKPVRR